MLRVAILACLLLQGMVATVHAADCAPATGSLTLQTDQDVASLVACPSFNGNVVVAADGPSTINLTGVTKISGNIMVENVANLTSLTSSTLSVVSNFTIENIPLLSTLEFPALSNFSSLKWVTLPMLKSVVATSGSLGGVTVHEISIIDTGITDLSWLSWPVGGLVNVSSNTALTTFSIPYASIGDGSALAIASNPLLTSMDVSQVTTIYGGLAISGNKIFKKVAFPKLTSVGGYLQLTGQFNNITMPNLNSIGGALSVEASGDITSLCSSLPIWLSGHYDCISNSQKATAPPSTTQTVTGAPSSSANGGPGGPGGPGPGRPITQGQAAGIAVSAVAVTIISIAAAVLLLRRRSKRKALAIQADRDLDSDTKSLTTLSTKGSDLNRLSDPGLGSGLAHHESSPNSPSELESPIALTELGDGKRFTRVELPGVVPVEMDGHHGVCELERGPERFELPA